MDILEITLGQIMFGTGSMVLILGGISMVLYLINYIINWVWWKKENRKDFYNLRYFLRHSDEIKKILSEKK